MGDVRKSERRGPGKEDKPSHPVTPGTLARFLWEERLCEELEQASDDGRAAPRPERLPPPPRERD